MSHLDPKTVNFRICSNEIFSQDDMVRDPSKYCSFQKTNTVKALCKSPKHSVDAVVGMDRSGTS